MYNQGQLYLRADDRVISSKISQLAINLQSAGGKMFQFFLAFHLVYICTDANYKTQYLRAGPITNASNQFAQIYSTSITACL